VKCAWKSTSTKTARTVTTSHPEDGEEVAAARQEAVEEREQDEEAAGMAGKHPDLFHAHAGLPSLVHAASAAGGRSAALPLEAVASST
jgi:hypothetical protein